MIMMKSLKTLIHIMEGKMYKECKGIIFSLVLAVCFLLTGCTSSAGENEIVVFAAASLTEPMNEIAELFMQENPGVRITFNFDSSGNLRTQIESGADSDIFVSASLREIEKLDGVDEKASKEILKNSLCLITSEKRDSSVESFEEFFEELKKGNLLLAIGNDDVPAGVLAKQVLRFGGIDSEDPTISPYISYGSNVKELVSQVSENMVDFAFVYSTDAQSANVDIVANVSNSMCDTPVYYAVMTDSENKQSAVSFYNYLFGNKAKSVFIGMGFVVDEEN